MLQTKEIQSVSKIYIKLNVNTCIISLTATEHIRNIKVKKEKDQMNQ